MKSQFGLTDGHTYEDWNQEILAAHAAGIDGFALNIGPNDHYTMPQLRQAYSAASSLFGGRFVLFLSFDMAAGEWPVEQVVACINEFKNSPAQCRVNGLPFVSTFEGPQWAENWPAVRQATGGIYFVPDWSSLGPHGVGEKLGLIDGACKSLDPQASRRCKCVTFLEAYDTLSRSFSLLGCLAAGRSAPHDDRRGCSISASSPWQVFHGRRLPMVLYKYGVTLLCPPIGAETDKYSGLPQWEKNWLSASEKLWYDRWIHMLELRPEFVQIITCKCLQLK